MVAGIYGKLSTNLPDLESDRSVLLASGHENGVIRGQDDPSEF
jgi:hypothetical protein